MIPMTNVLGYARGPLVELNSESNSAINYWISSKKREVTMLKKSKASREPFFLSRLPIIDFLKLLITFNLILNHFKFANNNFPLESVKSIGKKIFSQKIQKLFIQKNQ